MLDISDPVNNNKMQVAFAREVFQLTSLDKKKYQKNVEESE